MEMNANVYFISNNYLYTNKIPQILITILGAKKLSYHELKYYFFYIVLIDNINLNTKTNMQS